MSDLISNATRRNWTRLNADESSRLQYRANKTKSTKMIVPLEYFSDKDNIAFVQEIFEVKRVYSCTNADIIFSLAVILLKKRGIYSKQHVSEVISGFSANFVPQLSFCLVPENEWDILGLVYQCLVLEGERNQKGLYYSPRFIAKSLVSFCIFDKGQTFLDPCCGSGSLLLALDCNDPSKIIGIDIDNIAVFIAKINLLLKYSDVEFSPQIYCMDFLEEDNTCFSKIDILQREYDYIATNPPWGAVSCKKNSHEISSGESFSFFFVKSYKLLAPNGSIHFLFPESLLNVKVHSDIRRHIFYKCNIKSISQYGIIFSGVTTKCVSILCNKSSLSDSFTLNNGTSSRQINRRTLLYTDNLIFSFLTDLDVKIIEQYKKIGENCLSSNSVWALGIVTGNNKETLVDYCMPEYEPIYTGKEVRRYELAAPKKYIKYDRSKFQQVAKDEIYRSSEKLIYKFISNKLVFAYDNQKRLVLNSANVLIPDIDGMSIKTVLAFLNSELYQFIYMKLFGEVKVLKGNIKAMVFPKITNQQDSKIAEIVARIIAGNIELDNNVQEKIYASFGFDFEQIRYIRSCVYGTTDRRT